MKAQSGGLLKKQHDGYSFSRESEKPYNPFSLLETLRAGRLENYWYETGIPAFLVNLIKRDDFDPKALEITEGMTLDILRNSEPKAQNPVPILCQTGYLTLKEYHREFDEFILGFPNDEVG